MEQTLDEPTEEVLEPTEVPLIPSRRGKTLKVAKIVVLFENGTEDTWEFPKENPAFYREGGNRQTGSPAVWKTEAMWKTHNLWWTSDKMIEPVKHVPPGTPILDAHGRATGMKT